MLTNDRPAAPPPDPAAEGRQHLLNQLPILKHRHLAKKFFSTRRYLLQSSDIIDMSPEELAKRGLLSAWSFNSVETILAAIPAQILVAFCDLIRPQQTIHEGTAFEMAFGSAFDSISPYLLALAAPMTGLIAAYVAGRFSLWPEDRTKARVARARRAFMYYEAAHWIWGEAAIAVLWTFPDLAPRFAMLAALAPSWESMVRIGSWIAFAVEARVQDSLFAANGYLSAEASTSELIRLALTEDQPTREGPVKRYKWAMNLLAPAAVLTAVAVLLLGCFGAALALAYIRTSF